jgi:hypothetical protein
MSFKELPEFQKEIKRYSKRYKSLFDDLEQFCDVVSVNPLGNSRHFNIITQNDILFIVKARLLSMPISKKINKLNLLNFISRAIKKMRIEIELKII